MPEYLTTSAVAELLQVSDETVRRYAEAGRIRHIRLPSGQLRFLPADIDAILRPIEPTAPKAAS